MRNYTEAIGAAAAYRCAMDDRSPGSRAGIDSRSRHRLLIGFDGSSGAFDALALARDLAPEAEAILVYVPPHEDPVARHYRPVEVGGRAVPKDFFEEAVGTLRGAPVDTRAYAGASPAHILCDLTEREDFDLAVVGSPHRGAIGRALIGSVGEALLHGSRIPVVLAPRGYAGADHAPPRRIAVAYDTTPESDAALQHAEAMALDMGAALEVLTVVAPPGGASDALVESPSSRVEPYAFVEEAVARLDPRVEVRARKLIGSIADALADDCREEEVDLLVVGSRDYGPLRRALMGSVSN
jgi:nucleotide-binding universal stress UspA family protein